MSKHTPNSLGDSGGFTLVELLVVMVLTVLFSGLIMTFFLDLWSSTASLENDSETLVTRQDVGDALRDSLNATSGLINQNGIADANVTSPDSGDTTGTHWLILHAIPNNTAMPSTGTTPLMYYASPSLDTSKNFILNGTQPYQDEFVLYLNGNTKQLLLRTLANPSASGNRIRTSCPPAQATASCPADRLLADDISSVDKRYFSRSGNLLDWTSITDVNTGLYIGPDFPSVEVLELTLNLYRKSTLHAGSDTNNKTIVRVAFRNG